MDSRIPRRRVRVPASAALLAVVLAVWPTGFAPAAHAAFLGGKGQIAFTGWKTAGRDSTDIWSVTAGGKDPVDLTRGDGLNDSSPTFSPEGGPHIAYVGRHVGGGPGDIYVIERYPPGGGQSVPARLTSSSNDEDSPAWSPSGGKVAFSRAARLGAAADIWAMNGKGELQTNLTRNNGSGIDDREPAWSPDSSVIAFASDRGGSGFGIYTVTVAGDRIRKLADHGRSPNWSPDGRRLVYVRDGNVWVMSSSGSNQHRVTDAPANSPDTDPAWSPDGTRILVARSGHLSIMSPDGSSSRMVGSLGFPSADPDQQPVCTVMGTLGPDRLEGTPGSDLICGRKGSDVIDGKGGSDRIFAGEGADVVQGGPGNDFILGGQGEDGDVLDGGPGNDFLEGLFGDDRLTGGDGRDVIQGGPGNDVLHGADGVKGNDTVDGGTDRDGCTADSPSPTGDRMYRCEIGI